MSKLKIGRFTPPPLNFANPDFEKLDRVTKRNWVYAPSGRACLHRLLIANPSWQNIALPDYGCACLRDTVLAAKRNPIYIKPGPDLQIDFTHLSEQIEILKPDVLVAVGLYGYPLDMPYLEKLCAKHDIFLIDDAAQCFGASINEQRAGTFGQAGFFSFSPGKPLAGHGGAFYWNSKPMPGMWERQRSVYRFLKWEHFKIARLQERPESFMAKVYNKLIHFYERSPKIHSTAMASFELRLLGGVLNPLLNNEYDWRLSEANNLMDQAPHLPFVKPAMPKGTIPHPHKLILYFKDNNNAKAFIKFMHSHQVFADYGYASLSGLYDLSSQVVELPLPFDAEQRIYLAQVLKQAPVL